MANIGTTDAAGAAGGEALTPTEKAYVDSGGQTSLEPAAPGADTVTGGAAESTVEGGAAGGAEPKMVPLGALHEERTRRQDLQKEVERLNTRFDTILAKLGTAPAAAPAAGAEPKAPAEPIDPEKDPLGAMRQMATELAELRSFRQQAENGGQQANMVQALVGEAQAHETNFAKDNPDYGAASGHLLSSRVQELTAFGLNPVEINARINAERIAIIQLAKERGKNPAEIVYNLAKLRGYTKAAPAAGGAGANNGAGGAAGASPAAGAAGGGAPAGETEAARLERIAAGQRAGRSLGQPSGGGAPKPTAKAVSEMTDAQFAAWVAKADPAALREALGT